MDWTRKIIVALLSTVILTIFTSFTRSPWQTFSNGIMKDYHKGQPNCNVSPQLGLTCYDVHSTDYGFPWHTKKVIEIYGTYFPDTMPDIQPGTYRNSTGIIINFLFYFAVTLLSIWKVKSNSIWKDAFILLFIIDAIIGCILLLETRGWGLESIKYTFIILPLVNLLFLNSHNIRIAQGDRINSLKISFVLLLFANLIFGYNVFEQFRNGISEGFLGVIPFIIVLASNDTFALLFYSTTHKLKGIAKIIYLSCFAFISVVLLWSLIIFLPMLPYIISRI